MRNAIVLCCALAVGCGKAETTTTGSSVAKSQASGAPTVAKSAATASAGELGVGSLQVSWTGQFKPGDSPSSPLNYAEILP